MLDEMNSEDFDNIRDDEKFAEIKSRLTEYAGYWDIQREE